MKCDVCKKPTCNLGLLEEKMVCRDCFIKYYGYFYYYDSKIKKLVRRK